MTEKNGRTTLASRTRQKLANKGVVQCREDWAVGTAETDGFRALAQAGLIELTGEYLVTNTLIASRPRPSTARPRDFRN